jgi:hypothetical protein
LATDGWTSVQVPVELLAGDPQNRSAFSQRTTPDQLLVKTFPDTVTVLMPAVLGTRLSPPASDR